MAYKKRIGGTFKTLCYIEEPNEDGGFDSEDLMVEFKREPSEVVYARMEQPPLKWLPDAIVSWAEDFTDEAGKPVPFSPVHVGALLSTNAIKGIARGYFDACGKIKEKN
jgi:hypothetical protein